MLRVRDWSTNFETHESRKLKRLDWVSLPNDLLDLQYRMLIDHPDGAAHFGAWIAIVEIASACKIRGTLSERGIPLRERQLSLKSGLPIGLFKAAIPRLIDAGWLEDLPGLPGASPDTSAESPNDAGETSAYTNRDIDTNTDNKTICATNVAREADFGSILSVDNPPFSTVEPDSSFSETPKAKKRAQGMTPDQERWFTSWWSEYWLRKAKKAAREAFRKHVTSEERFQQVMAATRAQSAEMLSREPSKRPHGATWLNGERWNDEVTPVTTTRGGIGNAIAEALEQMDKEV